MGYRLPRRVSRGDRKDRPYADKMGALQNRCNAPRGKLLESPVQEGDHLGTVAGVAGTELGGGDAVGDAVF